MDSLVRSVVPAELVDQVLGILVEINFSSILASQAWDFGGGDGTLSLGS